VPDVQTGITDVAATTALALLVSCVAGARLGDVSLVKGALRVLKWGLLAVLVTFAMFSIVTVTVAYAATAAL
jgi:VIT1/CCC1 family predicted Fe2+/Mn2+ transporter